jgi:hypothetical protein
MIHFPSVGDLHFPILKQLTLKGVVVSEGVLHDVLAGCSVLESLELISELDGVRGVRMDNSISHPFGGQSRNIVAINVSVAQAGNCRDGNNARAWLTSQTCWFRDRNALLFLAWRAGAQVK